MCANTLNLPFIDFVYTISELNSVLGREIAVSWEGSPADAAFIFTTQATAILTCDWHGSKSPSQLAYSAIDQDGECRNSRSEHSISAVFIFCGKSVESWRWGPAKVQAAVCVHRTRCPHSMLF